MKNKILLTLLLFSAFFIACNNLDDVDATFRLDPENAIVDAESAQNILNGVYSKLRELDFVVGVNRTGSALGLSFIGFGTEVDLETNMPNTGGSLVSGLYGGCYSLIQEANVFLENIASVEDNVLGGTDAKNSLIAEARFLRALGHFYLLRSFARFDDLSSEFGISLRASSATDGTPVARSSVSESYDFINEDLDFVIANTLETDSYRANVWAAIGLKAKVKLYQKEYAEAQDLALQVINGSGRDFPSAFRETFSFLNASNNVVPAHESVSLLFGPFTNSDSELLSLVSNSNFFNTIYFDTAFASFDPRLPILSDTNKGFGILSFNPLTFNAPTLVLLRLEEIYLIHAEAAARENSGVDAVALGSLNAIRTRGAVGLPPLSPSSKAELLESIRMEKLLELATETGEEFYDIVRYHREGDLEASNVKPTLTNEDFFVLPIPDSELLNPGANATIVQNPGY